MNFEKMMQELQAEYLAAMPQKFIDINEHIAKKDIAILREDFHKLKGTGKTYGMPEISELGEVIEKICLNNKDQALQAASTGLRLLAAIHKVRLAKKPFALQENPEFLAIKKLV